MDVQPVVARVPADEALRERRVEVGRLRRDGRRPSVTGAGGASADRSLAHLGDERVVVPDAAVGVEPEPLVERRRQAQRHLELTPPPCSRAITPHE